MTIARLTIPFSCGQVIRQINCLRTERHAGDVSPLPALTRHATNSSALAACRARRRPIPGKAASTEPSRNQLTKHIGARI